MFVKGKARAASDDGDPSTELMNGVMMEMWAVGQIDED
jgi:hypothetical protein